MKLSPFDVALVTGGGFGFGEATVRRLAVDGLGVVIVDLLSLAGKTIADEFGDRVVFALADVIDEAVVTAVLDAAAALKTLRMIVNCPSVATPTQFTTTRS